MWKKILVPLDGSESAGSALDLALELASGTGTELEFVTVFDPIALPIDSEHVLAGAKQRASAQNVACTCKDLHGVSVASAIVEHADRSGSEAIVMGSHGRSGFARTLFGSVAEEVLKDANCAVLIVRAARVRGAQLLP